MDIFALDFELWLMVTGYFFDMMVFTEIFIIL